jgi:nucleoside diphosphate kinase
MILQVVNTTKNKFNQIRTTKENVIKEIKSKGWNLKDCKIIELKDELINTTYKSADGKNTAKY